MCVGEGEEGFHPSRVGWDERERGRKEGQGGGFVVKTRAVTPPEDKKKKHYHYHTEASETSLREKMQIDGGLWQGVRNKHHLQGKVEEKFV